MSEFDAPLSAEVFLPADRHHGTIEDFAKAVVARARVRPEGVPHHVGDAARRYMMLHNQIVEDQTPHLDCNLLRRLAERNPVIQAVILTIIGQILAHFRRARGTRGLGLKVVQKENRKELTRAAAEEAKRLEGIVFDGGMLTEHPDDGELGAWDGHYDKTAPGLEAQIRQLAYDMLTIDRMFITIEGSPRIGRKRDNPVMYWAAEDAGLIRMTDKKEYSPTIRPDLQRKVKYVMLDPVNSWGILREFGWDEGKVAVRNPRTEFLTYGYGKSPVECCLEAVVGILYGMNANKEWFTDSHIPQGLLNLIGQYKDGDLDALRLHFKTNIGTPGHTYEFPVISSLPGQGAQAQWIPFVDRTRMDMVFTTFINFCVALVAAVFQIAPEEFGFAGFGGPQQVLSEADPESTIQQSQHKGLLGHVLFLNGFISSNVVERVNADFETTIQGLESRYNPELIQELEIDNQRLAAGWTINQIRDYRDEPRVLDPLDPELWDKIEEDHSGKWFPTERSRMEAMEKAYKKAGGKLGDYANAPVSNGGAMAVWQAQHLQQAQDTQASMDQMAQGEHQQALQSESADAEGARNSMGELEAAENERDAGLRDKEAAAQEKGTMQVPPIDDASELARRSALKKSVRKVFVVGPRDG